MAGRTAYIDPKTGELTSQSTTPAGTQKTVQKAAAPIKYTTYSDGTVGAKLEGRFHTSVVATINCNGTITAEHSENRVEIQKACEEK